ncbi:ChbG/HpnK family deacetylase [Thermodesulfovibrionales bacterium]|nr:ChbG/HpnK family deacetylase [Thermodesulfovibrionales bacterium]
MLIINADDFGESQEVNKAIIQSFESGLCSSATLMPNMPGFVDACELSRKYKLTNHIGMHLVLKDGYPLTEKMRYFSKFCDQKGRLSLSRIKPTFYLSPSEKEVLVEEIRAQIKRCRDHGIPITHIDSHYHIHTEWGIMALLISIAREQGIPYIRLTRNCGPNINLLKKIYKWSLNYKIRVAGLARTRYFGSIEDFVFLKKQLGSSAHLKSFEIMIHPKFNEKQILVDSPSDIPLQEAIKQIDSYEQAVSFSGVKYKKKK